MSPQLTLNEIIVTTNMKIRYFDRKEANKDIPVTLNIYKGMIDINIYKIRRCQYFFRNTNRNGENTRYRKYSRLSKPFQKSACMPTNVLKDKSLMIEVPDDAATSIDPAAFPRREMRVGIHTDKGNNKKNNTTSNRIITRGSFILLFISRYTPRMHSQSII